MKIAFISIWFSENMGYIENCLPKALASIGYDIHVISSTAQVYFNQPDYDKIYEPYLGCSILPEEIKRINNYTLHRLDFKTFKGKIYLKNLKKKLTEINPDVVQTFDAFSLLTLQAAYYKFFFSYKLFTANHIVASVFPLMQKEKNNIFKRIEVFFTRTITGWIVSWVTTKCYPVTIDAMHIAVKYYGIPKRKVKLTFLGVDTDLFFPSEYDIKIKARIIEKRKLLNFLDNEILCLYTGRFTEGKNPLCLAKAVDKLVKQNEPYRALFIGDGPQSEEILNFKGCFLHKFIPYHELPDFYRMADIGIWPREESTSMIDASACGLPIIISNRVQAYERVDGNGFTYEENDFDNLAEVLLKMKDSAIRRQFSENGISKARNKLSWNFLAKERLADYESL